MPELLIQTCPGQHERDERFALVAIDVSGARVQRVSEVLSGEAMRTLLEGRGEPAWHVTARLAIARQQLADADCRPSVLSAR
jgi:hypothetical protein